MENSVANDAPAGGTEGAQGGNTNVADTPMEGADTTNGSAIAEDQKYWAAVRANPADFSSWTYLLQLVDQKGELESIRPAYEAFLSEFPLCYLYWKRYAEHEATMGSPQEQVVHIYERAVEAFPNSVDLWVYYASYLTSNATPDDPSRIRSAFERAVEKAGTDYLAQSLWDKYIEYELARKDYANVTNLYTRVLALPLEALSKYYERWKEYVNEHPVGDILNREEHEQLAGEESEDAKRDKVLQSREQVYQTAREQLAKIQPYESVLRERPYFHVKPVSDELLDTWHRYLSFQEAGGNVSATVKLYERCLVPCCNYIAYWRRYARFVEDTFSGDEVRRVWERATGKLLKRRPDPYLDFAFFQELQGQPDAARELYKKVLGFAPGHVETTLRYAQLEQRQRNFDIASAILEAAIENPKSDTAAAFLAIHYAHSVERFARDIDRARGIYTRALGRYPGNKNLWLAAIDFEIAQCGRTATECHEDDFKRVVSLYQQAIGDASLLTEDEKLTLGQRYIETIHALAPRPEIIRQVITAFMKAHPSDKPKSKKRRLEEEAEWGSASKKGTSTTAAQESYALGYGVGYPPTTAAAGYGAYGAYPQSTAYGSWPAQQGAYAAGTPTPAQQGYAGFTGYSGYQ